MIAYSGCMDDSSLPATKGDVESVRSELKSEIQAVEGKVGRVWGDLVDRMERMEERIIAEFRKFKSEITNDRDVVV